MLKRYQWFQCVVNGCTKGKVHHANKNSEMTPFSRYLGNDFRLLSTQDVKVKQDHKTAKIHSVNTFTSRSHTCGELTAKNVDEIVHLCGWVEFQRMGKFCTLRDSYGTIQIIINKNSFQHIEAINKLNQATFESVIKVTGRVALRPEKQINPNMETGQIEVVATSIDILNSANPQLPFYIRDFNKAKESLQMQYRYLALRFPELQRNLRIRSSVTMKMRDFLINQYGFVDIETPTLFRKTPGGAREYIVPTKFPGKFYSLVQSPQQFKQLLMVGGFDRYFQIAKCYRDEGSRSDRQPEFTQVDIEMSFVDEHDIMELTEKLLHHSWPEFLGTLKIPFPRMTYKNAIDLYGTESPDLRIPYTIHDITGETQDRPEDDSYGTYALIFPDKERFLTSSTRQSILLGMKKKFPSVETVQLVQAKVTGDTWMTDLNKLLTEETTTKVIKHLQLQQNDVIFLTRGPKLQAKQILGYIRVEFANILEIKGDKVRSENYNFLWITDFPLISFNEDKQLLETMHHPFTAPHPNDISYFTEDPLKVRGLHYDLVLNGQEIGGGSIRVHQRAMQEYIFKMLKIDPSNLYYLLEALDSGAPPHGGIAIGLDRYLSIICNAQSIREVIAFPKTMDGYDLMSGAPSNVPEEDKSYYSLKTEEK